MEDRIQREKRNKLHASAEFKEEELKKLEESMTAQAASQDQVP